MKVALYELTNQYLELADKLASLDLDIETISDTIEASGIVDSLQDKAQGIIHIARGAVAHNAAIEAEIARLRALAVSREKVAAGLHSYLLGNMERAGITKIDCPLFSIGIRKNPPSVEIMDSMSLPAEYWVTPVPKPPVPTPDKSAIKKALAAGVDVMGARMVQGTRLDIK